MTNTGQTSFRTSFQFQLFRLFTLLSAVITIVFAALYSVSELRKSRLFAEKMLQSQAQAFAESIRLPLYAENRQALTQAAEQLLKTPELQRVDILSAEGRLLARAPVQGSGDPGRQILRSASVRTSASLPSLAEIIEPDSEAGRNLIGSVRLYRGTDDLNRAARQVVFMTVALAILFWMLISYSCYRLLQRVTLSFQGLMRGLEKIHAGDYGARIEVLADDEPGLACVAVNDLAETLMRRDQENKRLTAELRGAMEQERDSKMRLASLNQSLEAEIEENLRARQELKNLVEQLPVGIIWSDAQGRIEYLNRFMRERFGYPPEQMTTVEECFQQLFPDPMYREQVLGLRRRGIAEWGDGGAAIGSWDVRAVCQDGSHRELNLGLQRSGGRVVDILIDLTEREQLQQQMIRNQKLESLGLLAGGIAHNFNNALTGVLGFISFARQFLDRSHRSYELLWHAERASKRAAGVARQLLTFARGGQPVKRAVLVNKLAQEAVLLACTGSKVVSRLELPPSLDAVYVDEDQISQAFNCICINAVQAMPEGGLLTVRGRNVSSRTELLPVPAEGEYVEIAFEDQGKGIPEKDQANIFTPYFTTKAEVGTGLGLATVHSIVTKHAGAISFLSSLGSGTTFTIYLPSIKVPLPAEEQDESRPAPPRGSGQAVLVMDDEEMIRDLAREVLESRGFRVVSCPTGAEATALYREAYVAGTPFLVAILDLTVPGGMGGTEVARQIRAIHPEARLIVSSGHSEDDAVISYQEHGFCAAAKKPYNAQELIQLLDGLQEQD